MALRYPGFFLQAEDGIRATSVTGVQTCALPISNRAVRGRGGPDYAFECVGNGELAAAAYRAICRGGVAVVGIGRASCRERVWVPGGVGVVSESSANGLEHTLCEPASGAQLGTSA